MRPRGLPCPGVTGFNLNAALRSYLLERSHATEPGKTPPPPQPTSTPLLQRRRLRDRLSEQDLSTLVENFRSGTSAHVLAKRYGVGETALKALLRQRGVRQATEATTKRAPGRLTTIKAEPSLHGMRSASRYWTLVKRFGENENSAGGSR